jgi:lipoprotein NlpD
VYRYLQVIFILTVVACLTACSSRMDSAPVSDISTIDPIPKNGIYKVSHGDTLYSIAWRYGLDYRTLASRNHLNSPYYVQSGQSIYLTKEAPSRIKSAQENNAGYASPITKPAVFITHKEPNASVATWRWPAHGQVIGNFSSNNKGINISGYLGEPIYATAAGKVVYSGRGLRGYGNLIIIKHNSKFLSAYAHNKTILVSEGEWVKSGQKIAEMGNTGSPRTLLHFEIRRNGQPINPLIYLSHKV